MNTKTEKNKTEAIHNEIDSEFEKSMQELFNNPEDHKEIIENSKKIAENKHKEAVYLSKKYNIPVKKLFQLSGMIEDAVFYMDSLCDNRKICVVEKKWGYEKDTILYGYIINLYKCKDITKNEIVIELMYNKGEVYLFKLDLDNPIISKEFRERFDDVFVLRFAVEFALVGLKIQNKKLRNGKMYSTVKDIVFLSEDDVDTFFWLTGKDFREIFRAKDRIWRALDRIR